MAEELKNNWAPYSLREVPFWNDNLSPEEYEIEQAYYFGNMRNPSMRKHYTPIWKQKLCDNSKIIIIDETWATPYMKSFEFWHEGMTLGEYEMEYKSHFQKLKKG